MPRATSERALRTRVARLSRTPLFEGLSRSDLEQIARRFTDTSLEKGAVVVREGERGDRCFILVHGELEVSKRAESGERLLSRIEPGEVFGETALLLDEPRNATVTVSRSAHLLSLDKASFDRWVLSNPKVLERLSRSLASRLARSARESHVRRNHRAIALLRKDGAGGASLVARTLALILHAIAGREVALVRVCAESTPPTSQRQRARIGHVPVDTILSAIRPVSDFGGEVEVELGLAAGGLAKRRESAAELLHELEQRFDVVLFDLAYGCEQRIFEAISDTVIEIVDRPRIAAGDGDGRAADGAGGGCSRYEIVDLRAPGARPVPINHCMPFVLRDNPAIRELDVAAAAELLMARPDDPVSITLHRLARKVLGATVGIALGGGAAFGISHVGVLKVLEDEGIPLDIVAGTSMGSIIGAGYAAGTPASQLVDIVQALGSWRTTLYAFLDWTLTRPALLSGERIADLVAAVEGNAERFEDLVRPYRAIGADVETGERVSMGTGSILQATRASAAVPIIWPPVRWQDRMLIDGSMIDPVPGEVVREMGADLCIAVNVVPPLRRGVETVISRWSRRFSRFNPLSHMGDAVGMPNMLDIFMNTIQMLQRELGDYKAIAADVRIHPDLSDFTWIEFYRSKELIERGIEAAQQAVPEVRRLLNARLAQGPRARTIPNFDLADRVDHPQTGAQQLPGGVHAQ